MPEVIVSSKWAHHLFACSVDYIARICHGRCCEGSGKILVSLLPEEATLYEAMGYVVRAGLLQPSTLTGKCPLKLPTGLCAVHGPVLQPFGCIASPFTMNKADTLIVRYRYSRLKCHGSGRPAYKVFRPSLDLIFGIAEAVRICGELDKDNGDVRALMPRTSYEKLRYLDGLKKEVPCQASK